MTALPGWALLAGLFAVPAALLALGHRLRERRAPLRGAFWGGVIGHTGGIVIAAVAFHVPPVLWEGGTRAILAFWAMPVMGIVGAFAGAALARPRGPVADASLTTRLETDRMSD